MSRSAPREPGDELRIWLLGGFRVAVGPAEITPAEWRLRKSRNLIKLLALASGHRLHREQLLEILWPALGPEAASNNMRKALHHARRALTSAAAPSASYLRFQGDLLSLAPDGRCWIDVDAFEQGIAEARRSGSTGMYRAALDLYAGDLLPEDRYEDWTSVRRDTLRQDHLLLLAELAGLHEREHEPALAIETLHQLLSRDPGREDAHRGLMRLYALGGQRRQALRQYELLRESIGREFDAGPDVESQQLHQDIAAGRFPAPGTERAPAGLRAGTITFLFTDIEGSTQLVGDLGQRYADLLTAHHRVLRSLFEQWGGQVVDTQGDAFFVAFPRARDALSAALAAQRAVINHPWPQGVSVRVRMGLHTGEPLSAETGYVGIDVHRAARICETAHGGQILISAATRELIEDDLPEGISLRDLGEHRLRDLARPQHLFQVAAQDMPIEFPPLRSLDRLPHNLPIQLTTFVGRGREIGEVRERLAAARQLTLTGTGGVGKTRLALEVAARVLEDFHDGVWLVDLSTLSDVALVPQAVAATLNIQEETGRSLVASLGDYLLNKKVLLLLDNCEHLAEVCAQLTESLLRRAPGLRVLATSRETLGMVGEAVYRVPSLSLPEARRLPDFDALIQYEAVRLFADRAGLSQPEFALRPDNAEAVARICRHLDGIPLAIELAAARVKALSVEAIAARLGDRFRLLTGGRTALPRHQTLRAVMDWSYDLLPEPERALLRRLSVFAGGFSLEAATAIGVREDGDEIETLDVLARLVDKSLVTVDQHPVDLRYGLLETVRQYGREKLLGADEADDTQRRHCDYFLALAERSEAELHRASQPMWLDRLETEHDNKRAALEWSLGVEGSETGLRLAAALAPYWHARGYLTEGREWMERARAYKGPVPPALTLKAMIADARLAFAQDDFSHTKRVLDEAVPIARALGDQRALVLALGWLAHATWHVGDRAQSTALCEESRDLARRVDDPWTAAVAFIEVATVAVHEGDDKRAAPLIEESLKLFRTIGDASGVAFCLYQLGSLALTRSDFRRAAELIEESLALQRQLGRKTSAAASLGRLGRIMLLQGEYDRAVAYLETSVVLAEELGKRDDAAIRKVLIGLAALARGDFGRAAGLFEEGLAIQGDLWSKFDLVDSVTALGILAHYREDYKDARRLLEGRLDQFRRFKGLVDTDPLYHLGLVVLAQGDAAQAAVLIRESLERLVARGTTLGVPPRLEGLARVGLALGQYEPAARLLGAAEVLRAAAGTPRWPVDQAGYVRDVTALRTALGDEAFAAAWAGGQAMTAAEAAEFALASSPNAP